MKTVKIALLGFGTVGKGVYDIISRKRKDIAVKSGVDIELVKILVRDKKKAVENGAPAHLLADNFSDILFCGDIDTVVEVIGGTGDALSFVSSALKAGKSVITANKELLSQQWSGLLNLAAKIKKGLYFEAACAGVVPVIRTLSAGLQSDKIRELYGIINGTTNYILTCMAENNISFSDALVKAQALGYAEANPAADVEGSDAASKLSILLSLILRAYVPPQSIFCEGISNITQADIEAAAELKCVIKMLATAKTENGLQARIHPCFVPLSHPLSSIGGANNAVFISGDESGDIMLSGQGAGMLPTASAVISDIIFCANQKRHDYFGLESVAQPKTVSPEKDFQSKYYMRILVKDTPGMLGRVSEIFGKNNVGIKRVLQLHEGDGHIPVSFLTHFAQESSVQNTVDMLKAIEEVNCVESVIRIM